MRRLETIRPPRSVALSPVAGHARTECDERSAPRALAHPTARLTAVVRAGIPAVALGAFRCALARRASATDRGTSCTDSRSTVNVRAPEPRAIPSLESIRTIERRRGGHPLASSRIVRQRETICPEVARPSRAARAWNVAPLQHALSIIRRPAARAALEAAGVSRREEMIHTTESRRGGQLAISVLPVAAEPRTHSSSILRPHVSGRTRRSGNEPGAGIDPNNR